jgi:hypothetical protein
VKRDELENHRKMQSQKKSLNSERDLSAQKRVSEKEREKVNEIKKGQVGMRPACDCPGWKSWFEIWIDWASSSGARTQTCSSPSTVAIGESETKNGQHVREGGVIDLSTKKLV